MPPAPALSIVIPAYDEATTIDQVVRRVLDLPFDLEVIAVDDGSSDGTAEILAGLEQEFGPRVRALIQPVNRGKGAAVRIGIAATTGDLVLIQDADLEYNPGDIPAILQPLLDGHADVVYGTRLRGGQPQRAHLFWHYAGNRFLSLMTNVLFNTTISDMEVGYKAFKGPLIRGITLVSDDFRFEPEVTAKVLRIPGIAVYEVPISYYGRTFAEGKKITWQDGFKAVGALIRFRIQR
jgi:glycosyltransferase involved in cell wall biosynthesis